MFSLNLWRYNELVKFESQVTEQETSFSATSMVKKSLSIMTVTGPRFCLFGTV